MTAVRVANVPAAEFERQVESVIAVGLTLKRQKERLPHGMFLPWIGAEFEMGEQSARRLMHVADAYANKSNIVLDLNVTALYELAAPSTPAEVRDRVESLLVDGQKVTVADIRKMKAEVKQTSDEELMRFATRVRDRAIRRAGELLKQIAPANGANQNIGAATDTKVLTRKDAAKQAGMSKRQQVTAIRIANVPADVFERQVESANPLTVTALAEVVATARELQADALVIIATADQELADEYDAAQKRGDVAGPTGNNLRSDAERKPTSADLGLSRKQIHQARQIRDPEKADPGIVKRMLQSRVDTGEEPLDSIVATSRTGLTLDRGVPVLRAGVVTPIHCARPSHQGGRK